MMIAERGESEERQTLLLSRCCFLLGDGFCFLCLLFFKSNRFDLLFSYFRNNFSISWYYRRFCAIPQRKKMNAIEFRRKYKCKSLNNFSKITHFNENTYIFFQLKVIQFDLQSQFEKFSSLFFRFWTFSVQMFWM